MWILESLARVEGMPELADDFAGMRSDRGNDSLHMHHVTAYVQGQVPGKE